MDHILPENDGQANDPARNPHNIPPFEELNRRARELAPHVHGKAEAVAYAENMDADPPPNRNGQHTPKPKHHEKEPPPADLGVLLSTVQSQKVEWLWPGRIPLGKLTIIDGDPGLGKSVLTLDLAARVSRGMEMPCGAPCKPAGVVLLSAEDGLEDTIVPRLEAAGADRSRILALDLIPDGLGMRLPSLPLDTIHVRKAIERMQAKLVVVDPITAYLGPEINSHRDQDVRRALFPLAKIAEETGAAFVVVRHLNKSTGGNVLYRGGGSIGIIGAARSGLLVAKDPDHEDRRILASTKCNLAKLSASLVFALDTASNGALRIGWMGESAHTAETLLAVPRDDEVKGELAEAQEVLREILAAGPAFVNEVKAQTRKAGVSERTLQRAKSALGVKSRKASFGSETGWKWFLPEHVP